MGYRIEVTVVDPTAATPEALSKAFVFNASMDVTKASLVEVQQAVLKVLTELNTNEIEITNKRGY
jgi:hypothetical protein